MKLDDLGNAYRLAQRFEQAQKVIAHLEAMNNADTVSLMITDTNGSTVTIGPVGATVGPLLKFFKYQAEYMARKRERPSGLFFSAVVRNKMALLIGTGIFAVSGTSGGD